jgi:sulfide:quinone oxidoreductase
MCFIAAGGGRAGIGKGNFYAKPTPQIEIHAPSLLWHAGKVLYEKHWLYRRF